MHIHTGALSRMNGQLEVHAHRRISATQAKHHMHAHESGVAGVSVNVLVKKLFHLTHAFFK